MANVKISQLPSLSTMTDIAQIPVVSSGTTYQITGANLSSYFGGGYGNANVAANLAAFANNTILTTGNIGAGNINVTTATGNLVFGRASATGSPGVNSTNSFTVVSDRFGTPKEWVFTTDGSFTGSGNITGGNVITVGTISAASVSASGNITGGNIVTGGASGNITGANVISGTTLSATSKVITAPVAYSTLTAAAGARAFVNDGNLVASGNFGAQVSGGGANTVPVWSNGTNWYVG